MRELTEMEYQELKDYAFRKGAHKGLIRQECEDILHKALLTIVREEIPKPEWKEKIFSYIGKAYQDRKKGLRRKRSLDTNYVEDFSDNNLGCTCKECI